jgi:lipopolysaccharide transport system ATP-binding protein
VLAIEVDGVSKRFRRKTIEPATTLKTSVVDLLLGRRRPRREPVFQALRDITFAVGRGQTFGIIGRNGSGKSTLLRLLAGIYRPDAGHIRVHGRVAGLLEPGAGFHPEFSGRENIFINGILLGLSKREVRRRFDDIVRFAEFEGFINEPVRTYSSGMYVRLAFAVAVHTDPDVLLIDEALSVGDEAFRRKCAGKIAELQRNGKTLVLVSHDLKTVASWCDVVAWLDDGTIRQQGDPQQIIDSYRQAVGGPAPRTKAMQGPESVR